MDLECNKAADWAGLAFGVLDLDANKEILLIVGFSKRFCISFSHSQGDFIERFVICGCTALNASDTNIL